MVQYSRNKPVNTPKCEKFYFSRRDLNIEGVVAQAAKVFLGNILNSSFPWWINIIIPYTWIQKHRISSVNKTDSDYVFAEFKQCFFNKYKNVIEIE